MKQKAIKEIWLFLCAVVGLLNGVLIMTFLEELSVHWLGTEQTVWTFLIYVVMLCASSYAILGTRTNEPLTHVLMGFIWVLIFIIVGFFTTEYVQTIPIASLCSFLLGGMLFHVQALIRKKEKNNG